MNIEAAGNEWFSTWFDSPYYHVLYGHRDETDASHFLDRLTRLDFFKPQIKIADVCCGKGRHAAYLNQKGFEVYGYDLSVESISHCQKLAKPGVSFHVHDIRSPLPHSGFDLVLNLFTSYGYFETNLENVSALKNMCNCLKPGGHIIIDYLNVHHALHNLVKEEVVEKEGIRFHIQRSVSNKKLIKTIQFSHADKSWEFHEQVALLELSDFEKQLTDCGMVIQNVFGNYDLHPYETSNSTRLIIVASTRQS